MPSGQGEQMIVIYSFYSPPHDAAYDRINVFWCDRSQKRVACIANDFPTKNTKAKIREISLDCFWLKGIAI